MIEEALSDGGFEIALVATGEEAVTLLKGKQTEYRALVTDINLSGELDGWDVAREAREIDPAFPIIYMTGAAADEWGSKGVPNSILLSKPFAPAQLVTAISQLLNAGSSPATPQRAKYRGGLGCSGEMQSSPQSCMSRRAAYEGRSRSRIGLEAPPASGPYIRGRYASDEGHGPAVGWGLKAEPRRTTKHAAVPWPGLPNCSLVAQFLRPPEVASCGTPFVSKTRQTYWSAMLT